MAVSALYLYYSRAVNAGLPTRHENIDAKIAKLIHSLNGVSFRVMVAGAVDLQIRSKIVFQAYY